MTQPDEQRAAMTEQRAAFEAAMRVMHPLWSFTTDPVFDYHNERTRNAWEGWQACASRLSALPAGGGWKPIESAPKDGTEFLGWREDCGVMIVQWTCPQDFLSEREVENELDDMEGEDRESLERAMEQYDWFGGDSILASMRLEGDEVPTLWLPMPPVVPAAPQ